jgi:hypothetical protein
LLLCRNGFSLLCHVAEIGHAVLFHAHADVGRAGQRGDAGNECRKPVHAALTISVEMCEQQALAG